MQANTLTTSIQPKTDLYAILVAAIVTQPVTVLPHQNLLSPTIMTLADHESLFRAVYTGLLPTPDTIRDSFERLVRDQSMVLVELGKLSKDQLAKKYRLMRTDTKAFCVQQSFQAMVGQYASLTVSNAFYSVAGFGVDAHIADARKRLATLTAEMLQNYRDEADEAARARAQSREDAKNALANPVTLKDFETLIRVKGAGSLTRAQTELYEELLSVAVISQCKPNPEKDANRIERFLKSAKRLEDNATQALGVQRLTNTRKRAEEANHAERRARIDLFFARTSSSLGAAILNGQVTHLARISSIRQVHSLVDLIRNARRKQDEAAGKEPNFDSEAPLPLDTDMRYVVMPNYDLKQSRLEELIAWLSGQPGSRAIIGRFEGLKTLALKNADGSNPIIPIPASEAQPMIDKFRNTQGFWWRFLDIELTLGDFSKMGITTDAQLRCACRELLQYMQDRPSINRAAQLERALVGQKIGTDFFPTPKALCQRMVAIANPQPGMTGCDPQAGNGNIAEAIREAGVEPLVVEISELLREILEAKGFQLIGRDFLQVQDQEFDFIIANPPFSDDIAHTRHAFSLLRDKGILVTIVGEGSFIATRQKQTQFQAWLESLGAEIEKLPPNSFSDKTLLATTGANARLVIIRK